VTGKTPFEIRLELAQGHWELAEYDEALRCLERALESTGESIDPRLAELAWGLANSLTMHVGVGVAGGIRERLMRIVEGANEPAADEPPFDGEEGEEPAAGIATPTLAELLASQGHTEQALRVTDEVLARSPEDPRALAVRRSLEPEPEPERGPGPGPGPEWEREPEARGGGNPRIIAELERWLRNLEWRRAEGGVGA
jgi:tetratricopeptide (TPR) repeat protein